MNLAPGRFVLVLSVLLAGARVEGAPGAASPDRVVAERTLAWLRAQGEDTKLVAETIAEAERALTRAATLRGAGDAAHAALLDSLAREHADMAKSLLRAARLEARLSRVERRVATVETKTLRARALIEETLARKQRASEKLRVLKQGQAPTPRK